MFEVVAMSFPLLKLKWALLPSAALLVAAGISNAQSADSQDASNASGYSSSRAGLSDTGQQLTEYAALPDSPEPAGSSSAVGGGDGQYGNGGGYGGEKHGLFHKLTFEAGGGFNAPISNGVTYGANFTAGGGMRFNPHFSTLIEYQFIDDKIPGAIIAETNGQATGAHAHIWSFTLDPVYDFYPKATNDFYVTGGGGFYRKVTTFTFPEPEEYCTYFYCGVGYAPGTVGHFSSNQGGFNIGGGYQRRLGGMYGDSHTTLFAEVRYLDVLSPAIIGQSANGLPPVTINKDTEVLPVTLGVRW
jgi:hypothetical protein